MAKRDDDDTLRGELGDVEQPKPSELLRRAAARSDRRGGGGIRRGGRSGRGSWKTATDLLLYALRDFSTLSRYETAVGGGEPGTAATGVGIAILARYDSHSATQVGVDLVSTIANNSQGYYVGPYNNLLTLAVSNGSGGFVGGLPVARSFTQGDVGKIFLLLGWFRVGAGGGVVAAFNRDKLPTPAALPGYTPGTRTVIGARPTGILPASNFSVLAVETFRSDTFLTQEAADEYADLARLRGDLPGALRNAALTHRWSVKDAMRTRPARTRRLVGARAFSVANVLISAAGAGVRGLAGQPLTVAARVQLASIAGNQIIACCTDASASTGWLIQITGNALRFVVASGGTLTIAGGTLAAADVGRDLFVVGQYTGTAARLYLGVAGGSLAQFGATVTGAFTPAPAENSMLLGAWPAASQVLNGALFSFQGGLGLPALIELQRVSDLMSETGMMPAIAGLTEVHGYELVRDVVNDTVPAQVQDRFGTDHLTRSGNVSAALVQLGPQPPAFIEDTATRAEVDKQLRTGGPAVVEIDPARDGVQTRGAQGFSTTNFLAAASALALSGQLAGFFVVLHFRVDALAGAAGSPAATRSSAVLAGWDFYLSANNANLHFEAGAPSNYVSAGPVALTAADLGQPLVVIGVFTGSVLRLYVKRPNVAPVQAGVDVALSAFQASTSPVTIGSFANQTFVGNNISVFGLSGGHVAGGLSPSEAFAIAEETERTGQVVALPGKTQWHWPIGASVATDAIPAQVLDRVGSAHLTRVGGQAVRRGDSISGWTPSHYFATAPGGGIAGASTGFWAGCVFRHEEWLNFPRILMGRAEVGGQGRGWYLQFTNGGFGALTAVINNGANATVQTSGTNANDVFRTLQSRFGEVWHFAMRFDGAFVTPFFNGIKGDSVAVPNAYVAMPGERTYFGLPNGATYPAGDGIAILGGGGGHATPTDEEMAAAAAASIAQARFVAIPNRTDAAWDLRQDIADASGAVPSRSLDRIGNGGHMTRSGAPLVVAQRTERLWSYDAAPVMHGASDMNDTNHYTIGNGPCLGDKGGHFLGLLLRVNSQVGTGARVLACQSTANAGWEMRTTGTNSTMFPIMLNAAGATQSGPVTTIAASEVGRFLLYMAMFDPLTGRLRGFVRRTELAAQTIAGYSPTPANTPLMIGRNNLVYPGSGTAGVSVFGLVYGIGVLTPAEVFAHHDAVLAQERMLAVPGRACTVIRFDKDGNADGMQRVGNPPLATAFARAFAA